jgi:hypothetical protein
MTLRSENGMVDFIMATGKDFVKNTMPENAALDLIENGKTEITDTHKGFPLCVDDKYYFPEVPEPAEVTKPTSKKKR